MSRNLLITILFCFASVVVIAQVETRSTAWYSGLTSIRLNGKWGFQFDLVLRTGDEWKYLQTMMLKPGISYKLSGSTTAFVGYNNVQSRVVIGDVSGYASENQIWEQLFIRHRLFNRLNTLHRPLLEQRFLNIPVIKNNSIETGSHAFVLRLRYLFRNVLPFKNLENFVKGTYAVAQQEILLNMGDKSAVNGKTYDQLRVLTGLGYRFSSKFDLETGYLFRDIATRTSLHFHDHILQLTSILRL
jgi:hypothetical protein